MKIWIDGDACPLAVKEIVYKAAQRLKIATCLVANKDIRVPRSEFIESVRVASGFDVADTYIVQNAKPNDMVITADVPLAALVVQKGALAINPRGELYNEGNITERLSVRNFMQSMRDSGMLQGGGPAPFQASDKQRFASTFDKQVYLLLKKNRDESE